jgi:hypothetical protein
VSGAGYTTIIPDYGIESTKFFEKFQPHLASLLYRILRCKTQQGATDYHYYALIYKDIFRERYDVQGGKHA